MSLGPSTALSPALLLPLGSGFVYVLGALFLKRAADLGVDAWRTARVCNFTIAALFAPFLFLDGFGFEPGNLWQPAVAALLFVAGQVLSLLALNVGDVSVATPVLGVKIPLVAFLTTLLIGEGIGAALWVATLLSCAAIALLNFSRAPHHHVGRTILLATLAACAYALFDVLVQKWTPAWGAGRFLPAMMVFTALVSLALRPWGRSTNSASGRPDPAPRNLASPAKAGRWLAAGAVCLGVQGMMFVGFIALHGQATVANVLYSSRGLWSVVAVWLIGHWFSNREQHHGSRILFTRLLGACLLLTAILLVLWGGGNG